LSKEPDSIPVETKDPQANHLIPGFRVSNKGWLVGCISIAVFLFSIWFTTQNAQASLQDIKSAGRYSQASSWLIQNTPIGARIFQTDWDDFPRLFFYNTWNTYLIGLDPTYLHLKDSDLFGLWVEITQGKEPTPSEQIYQRFAAEYVLTDLLHEKFIDQAGEDAGMKVVYRDEEAIIYRVFPPKNQ